MLRKADPLKIPVHPVVEVYKEIPKNTERFSNIVSHPGAVVYGIRVSHIADIVDFKSGRPEGHAGFELDSSVRLECQRIPCAVDGGAGEELGSAGKGGFGCLADDDDS